MSTTARFREAIRIAEADLRDRPRRIQLSRRRGWRMPPNTVKVDRSTPLGNPFVVGRDGEPGECVRMYAALLGGLVACGPRCPDPEVQLAARKAVLAALHRLRGKNLACWCRKDAPCHADVLLVAANPVRSRHGKSHTDSI